MALINFVYDGMGIISPVDKIPRVLSVYIYQSSKSGDARICILDQALQGTAHTGWSNKLLLTSNHPVHILHCKSLRLEVLDDTK